MILRIVCSLTLGIVPMGNYRANCAHIRITVGVCDNEQKRPNPEQHFKLTVSTSVLLLKMQRVLRFGCGCLSDVDHHIVFDQL